MDSDVITERDNGVDRHDVSLVDILADRSRVADVITFQEEWDQALVTPVANRARRSLHRSRSRRASMKRSSAPGSSCNRIAPV